MEYGALTLIPIVFIIVTAILTRKSFESLMAGSVIACMIMHGTNNALSVLLFYLGTYVWDMTQAQLDALGTEHTWWLTLVCTPLMLAQVYAFRKGA